MQDDEAAERNFINRFQAQDSRAQAQRLILGRALSWAAPTDPKDRLMSLPDTASRTGSFDTGKMQDLSTGRIRRAVRTVRQMGLLQIIALIRQHGARKSLAFAGHNIRHMIAHRLALRWDRDHGVDTAGSIQLHSLTVTGPNRDFGNEAVCTSPQSFDFMMQSLPRNLGALYFRRYRLRQIADAAVGLALQFRKDHRRRIRQGTGGLRPAQYRKLPLRPAKLPRSQRRRSRRDAVRYSPTRRWCCFSTIRSAQNVFDAVLKNIVASLRTHKRDCYIVYGSSSHNAIGWAKPAILAGGLFEEVPAAPMPLFFDAVRTVNYAVFRAGF